MREIQYNISASRCYSADKAYLRRMLPKASGYLLPGLNAVSIALVGDRRMAALHQQFLSIEGPTDVLTFELEHDQGGRCLEGEIVICVTHAARQARQQGSQRRDEILLYAIHGLLHLSGHDDQTAKEFRRIHAMEDRILRAIGVGTVFDRNVEVIAGKRR